MLRFLTSNPDALGSGDSSMPMSVARLANQLVSAGVAGAKSVCCPLCGRSIELPYKRGNGRICRDCYSTKVHVENCFRCNRTKPVVTRVNGKPVCTLCWNSDPANQEICSACKTLFPVAYRIEGEPFCQLCGPRPTRRCGSCGNKRPIHSTKSGVDVCRDCHTEDKRGPRKRQVVVRHRTTRQRVCSLCGEKRGCVSFASDQPMCIPCAGRVPRRCSGCGQYRTIQAFWGEYGVCNSCYCDNLRVPRECITCARIGPMVPTSSGLVCRECLGLPTAGRCKGCFADIDLYADGYCASCVVRKRAEALLCGSGDSISEDLLGIYTSL